MSEKPVNDGPAIAAARDAWLETDEGARCLGPGATGQYLRNRLERAFIAGWDAARAHQAKQELG